MIDPYKALLKAQAEMPPVKETRFTLHAGDPCLYQPIGSKTPHIPCTVLDIRRKQITPGVFGDSVTRVKIRDNRGGWVNASRIFPREGDAHG